MKGTLVCPGEGDIAIVRYNFPGFLIALSTTYASRTGLLNYRELETYIIIPSVVELSSTPSHTSQS